MAHDFRCLRLARKDRYDAIQVRDKFVVAAFAALAARRPRGIVLSGGPDSVHQRGAPRCDPRLFQLGVPVVGICYGMQLMSHVLGGEVKRSGHREYGQAIFSPKPGGTNSPNGTRCDL